MKLTKKIEYYVFIILLFFQNFAVITTKDFGINSLVMFMLIISIIRYKKYYMKINIKFFIFIFISISVLICGSLLNDMFYILQIIRSILVIWLVYVVYIYMKEIYKQKHQNYFWKSFCQVTLVMLLYGVYEYFANKLKLPLFMNIFSNNPSYAIYSINSYYGHSAWIGTSRLHNVFFEPSVFSVFLVYILFLIRELKSIPKLKKIFIYVLILFNLYFTYARTGYVMCLYIIAIYFAYKILHKNARILDIIFLLIPFINIIIMHNIGLALFKDLSSLQRTYSAMYYLQNAFDSFKSIIIGHGCGSIVNADRISLYIGKSAQNGYSDLLYQYGFIYFTYLGVLVKGLLNKIKVHRYLIMGVIATFCTFGVYFIVETIMALAVIIYVFCTEEIEENKK